MGNEQIFVNVLFYYPLLIFEYFDPLKEDMFITSL